MIPAKILALTAPARLMSHDIHGDRFGEDDVRVACYHPVEDDKDEAADPACVGERERLREHSEPEENRYGIE